jgi:hypothetical protein
MMEDQATTSCVHEDAFTVEVFYNYFKIFNFGN